MRPVVWPWKWGSSPHPHEWSVICSADSLPMQVPLPPLLGSGLLLSGGQACLHPRSRSDPSIWSCVRLHGVVHTKEPRRAWLGAVSRHRAAVWELPKNLHLPEGLGHHRNCCWWGRGLPHTPNSSFLITRREEHFHFSAMETCLQVK